jgi:L-alanine-DL-glutamate epimerase-like enolase superfamily enzyme
MTTTLSSTRCLVEAVDVRAYTIPTDGLESDGTLEWRSTTMVFVEVRAGGQIGIGYTYADAAAGLLIRDLLVPVLLGADALQTAARWNELYSAVRNNGREGISSMAVSALDIALWDLKGKLLGSPVCALLGSARDEVPVYGSGGFTSYDLNRLTTQMSGWVHELGVPRVKMKIGRDAELDPSRVAAVRRAIGDDAALFVDANGAYSVKQALELAMRFAEERVCWFEEPVDHRNLDGNAAVCARAPAAMEISNGEYAFSPEAFVRIVDSGAADVLQADVTRCGGFSGFAIADAICAARCKPLSSHCAPYATLHGAMAAKTLRHAEYFHDHVRIERLFFDGTEAPHDGALAPDLGRPGIGLELKRADAERFAL